MVSPRKTLADLLAPHMPKKWRMVESQRNLETVSDTTVQIKLSTFEPLDAAPALFHEVGFTVTIITPLTDIDAAEDDLDWSVVTLLHALDEIGVKWTTARKVVSGSNLAYDIEMSLQTQKEG